MDPVGLDESDLELLDQNRLERDQILLEINELKERNERRKKEREEEEHRLAAERAAEEQRRKAEEEERRKKKEEDDIKRKQDRALKMAEFEKWKNPPKANFVISKKIGAALGSEPESEQDDQKNKKSKEQLESEKKAILAQRIRPLDVSGYDSSKLAEKAKELHTLIARLEGEKYDLEKRYKTMQVQLMELADRARQQNVVGKEGGLKRVHGSEETVDVIQTRFAGAPSKVEMYSKYERQKDKRSYDDRKEIYTGPLFSSHAERIQPQKVVAWNEERMPTYQ
ncbi:hypothetical protein HELRODRAFT_109499 [Helobdella robusta]|uniref:Troponin T n=1 Tax=Helobdella robusta TaxID=6412 RepID=T1EEU3_HELRO|nr:hypothetical protein HELRODRAFT_109499 [Helobdella robusta]ESO10187.1 hypothetical protein HELRODRAFT_109499 [Helobdella robusta]